MRVSAGQFGSGPLCGEHPGYAGSSGISLIFPFGDLGNQLLAVLDAAIEALAAQDADLDLDDALAKHRDFIMKTTCASYVFD